MMNFLRHGAVMVAGCLALTFASSAGAEAQGRIEVGRLTCVVAGGEGFIFGSTKRLNCTFHRVGEDAGEASGERYRGTITKYGLDVGTTEKGLIAWGVLALSRDIPPNALAGTYRGASAEASVGLGGGANLLIGGSQSSIVLQPLSIQAQEGLNLAVAISRLSLSPTEGG